MTKKRTYEDGRRDERHAAAARVKTTIEAMWPPESRFGGRLARAIAEKAAEAAAGR